MLSGQMGTYSQWKEEDAIANGSTVANIDGNAQYEATWNITGDGTGSIEFLILQISGSDSSSEDYKNFTADQYPDLKITVDEVILTVLRLLIHQALIQSIINIMKQILERQEYI